MKIKQALAKLAKYFEMEENEFVRLPKRTILEWAAEIGANYQLSRQQHAWLIGEIQYF